MSMMGLTRKVITAVLLLLLLMLFFFLFSIISPGLEDADGRQANTTAVAVLIVLYFASLVHVFVESMLMRERPLMYTLMVGIVVWPLGYLLWLMVWPGSLRRIVVKKLLGPDSVKKQQITQMREMIFTRRRDVA